LKERGRKKEIGEGGKIEIEDDGWCEESLDERTGVARLDLNGEAEKRACRD
jgi:hypothetical protein